MNESRSELDSHADTSIVGINFLITHDYDKHVNVTGYDPTQGSVNNLKVVSAALAYDCPHTGEVYIFKLNQAISVPTMNNNLVCPMQLRMNDIKIFDCPKFLIDNPSDHEHSIVIPREDEDDYSIPLSLHGVTSYFPTRKPTMAEWDDAKSHCIELTYDTPEWEPHSNTFHDQEVNAFDNAHVGNRGPNRFLGSLSSSLQGAATTVLNMSTNSSSVLSEMSPILNDDYFISALRSNVQVSLTSSKKRSGITPEALVQNWGIGLEAAKRTVEATTQRGIRTVANASLSRRFRTNDRQLRYRRINTDVFTDTMQSSVISKRKNKYCQLFSAPFGWARAFPMQKKSDAHEGLSTLFKRDGVPNNLIMDGSKEQTLAKFRTKCRESDCHVKQVEPHSPWSNSCEGTIKMVKQAAGMDLRKSKCPKVLWDDCIERQCYIRSFTAHDNHVLKGETPETMINGETPDISEFAEYQWYEWVKFRDAQVAFPGENFVLARYLGPSFDIGPAMTAKLLKENGQYIHRSTYRGLTEDEMNDPLEIKAMERFDIAVNEKLGECATLEDFGKEELDVETPTNPLYEDDCDE